MQVIFTAPSSPENYYHAISDYFVPYFQLFNSLRRLNTESTVAVETRSPEKFTLFKQILAGVLPKHTLIFREHGTGNTLPIQRIRYGLKYRRTISLLTQHVKQNLDLPHRPDIVLLISRRDAARADKIADGRPHIRTIVNNKELVSQVEHLCRSRGVQFQNVYNEDLTFIEQLKLYHRSKCVIGQHGAGLTNIIWMQRGTHCFEIQCSNRLPFFRQIAKAKRVNYHEVAPISFLPSMPTSEMLEHEKGRDETVNVAINDILNPLAKLLVHK